MLWNPEVRAAVASAIEKLEKRGARVKEVSLPQLAGNRRRGKSNRLGGSHPLSPASRLVPGACREYGEDVRTRLEMGTTVTAVNYLKARALRENSRNSCLNLAL